jgi:hypothetical protein
MSTTYSNYKMHSVPGDNIRPDTGHWLVITLGCSEYTSPQMESMSQNLLVKNIWCYKYMLIKLLYDRTKLWPWRTKVNLFYCPNHDNRAGYTFYNLDHLLLYINNTHILLSINTQKLQYLLMMKTCNVRVKHDLLFDIWQIEQVL